MLARQQQLLLAPLFLSLAVYIAAGPAAADLPKSKVSVRTAQTALDPSVIDPVGKLAEISNNVARSSKELASISEDLDKLTTELEKVEKERPRKVTKASFEALQKRFNDTIARSYEVEKRVKDSLTKSQMDIENVHKALRQIQSERRSGSGHRPVMTDQEIAECLKDLDDERATIKALQQSLQDDPSKQGAKVAEKSRPAAAKKNP